MGKFQPPLGMTEPEVLAEIEHVVRVVCGTFGFGYYDAEDIEQEARMWALDALPRYDPAKARLRNFLWPHVYFRLLNLQRNKLMRPNPPCKRCHAGDFCGAGVEGGAGACPRYVQWVRLNAAKAGLMQPAGWSEATDSRHADFDAPPVGAKAESDELWARIDRELPAHLRADFLRLKEGAPLCKARQVVVLEAVRAILGVDPSEGGDGDG